MDHRQLLNFLSVCEEKSFSNAAKRCFITHQGLSKSIKQLENEFDVPLFLRTSSGIEVTEFGKALQDAILPYMSQHDKIMDMMCRLKSRSGQCLSIGLINGYHKCLPPYFFSLFMDTNPDISIDIMSFSDALYQQPMLDYNISIGFSDAPVNESLFESLFFKQSKIGLAVGEKHRFSKSGSIKLHELKGEQLIVLNDSRHLIDFCYRNDIIPHVRLGLADLDLVSELCASGRMACFLGNNIPINLTGLAFIDIEDSELYFETHLVANRNTHKSAAVEKFIAYAREQLSGWAPSGTPPRTEQGAD
jgi:DNA-binding transcriptional LysR family regulator